MKFLVSVIIPVYNGEHFVKKAIQSALKQIEVIEVVVVNDGSTDKTLDIITKMLTEDPRIKIYHHNNFDNKGRSASRNLGIKKAKGNFIAFLDADDFYLENRFLNDKKVFEQNDNVDGVYNAIGVEFYREAESFEVEKLKLTTLNKRVKPNMLFQTLLSGKDGHFSIDGLTIKKTIFNITGFFNEKLLVAEDTELIFKMALTCVLEPGIIEKPLAKRGVHQDNVSNKEDLYQIYRAKMFESLLFWGSKTGTPVKIAEKYLIWLWQNRDKENRGLFSDIIYWLQLTIKSPKYLFSYLTLKYFPVVKQRQKLFPFWYK